MLGRRRLVAGLTLLPALTLLPVRAACGGDERIVEVGDTPSLQTALLDARPADRIRLTSGVYAGRLLTTRGGAAAAPVTIEAATPLRSVIRGALTLAHPHLRLEGLTFDDTQIEVLADDIAIRHCRLQNFRTTDGGTADAAIVHKSGHGLEVGHCEFVDFGGSGIDSQPRNGARALYIHHCHAHRWLNFQKKAQRGRFFGRIGATDKESDINAGGRVEHNLIDNSEVGGLWPNEWTFELKASSNRLVGNHLVDCGGGRGAIGVRHGEDNLVLSNRLSGLGAGIIVCDRDNQVIGNDMPMADRGIRLFCGQANPAIRPYDGGGGIYAYASHDLLAHNTAKVFVGWMYGDRYAGMLPASDNAIEAHRAGDIVLQHEVRTQQRTQSDIADPGPAPFIKPGQVGPGSSA